MHKPHSIQSEQFPGMASATPNTGDGNAKVPFDIDDAMDGIRAGVQVFRKAALFELADDGFGSPFEQLLACIISIRTRDEETVPISRRLFSRARTPAQVAALSAAEIDALIAPSTFHGAKAPQIREIARKTVEEFGGKLPCDLESLLAFRGVGIKCANLVLGIACSQPRVGVDIHVHRITNRWGYVATSTPEKNDRCPRRNSSETVLGGNQRTPCAVRQACLHWQRAPLLDVPGADHVQAGRRDQPPLSIGKALWAHNQWHREENLSSV